MAKKDSVVKYDEYGIMDGSTMGAPQNDPGDLAAGGFP